MNKIIRYMLDNARFLTLLTLASALLIYGVVSMMNTQTEAIMTGGDWGLSFGAENTTPQGNATAAEMKKYDAYFLGDTSKQTIYLTFDAGYDNGYTDKILDTLKKHNVKAAFFVVSHYLKSAPELVKRMAADGHIVANHTSSHPDMSKISSDESFAAELAPVEVLYKEITGEEMKKFYRPPQGKYSVENLASAQRLGYTTVFWSLAYADWDNDKQPSHDYALSKLNSRIHNGAVVLLHLTSKTNAEILDELLTGWENAGYSFGTLEDLIS